MYKLKNNNLKVKFFLFFALFSSMSILISSSCSTVYELPTFSSRQNLKKYITPLLEKEEIYELFYSAKTNQRLKGYSISNNNQIEYISKINKIHEKSIKVEVNSSFKKVLNERNNIYPKFLKNITVINNLDEFKIYNKNYDGLFYDYVNFENFDFENKAFLTISQIATNYKNEAKNSSYGYSLLNYKLEKNEIFLKLGLLNNENEKPISYDNNFSTYIVWKTYFISVDKLLVKDIDFENLKISILN